MGPLVRAANSRPFEYASGRLRGPVVPASANMRNSAASRACKFIGCDGLDQARVIVPHVPYPRSHRPTRDFLCRIGREKGFELRHGGGLLPNQAGYTSGVRTTGIRLVDLG